MGDKAVNQLDKSVNSKLEATVARQIQAQFQTTGKQVLQVCIYPALSRSTVHIKLTASDVITFNLRTHSNPVLKHLWFLHLKCHAKQCLSKWILHSRKAWLNIPLQFSSILNLDIPPWL